MEFVGTDLTQGGVSAFDVGGGGTVTSVGVSAPSSIFTVSSSPVTTAGTIALAFATGQIADRVIGSDSGGAISLLALTANHIPSLAASKITSGTFAEARGGTNQSTYTTGDMLYASASNTLSKRSIGTSGQHMRVTSGVPTWADNNAAISFNIDGGGSAITTGIKGDVGPMPFDCEIIDYTILADQSGSIVVDIWKDTYANYPPVDADSITASAPVTISSATKAQNSTLTGWTKAMSAGDILRFNVDSAATVTRVQILLKLKRT